MPRRAARGGRQGMTTERRTRVVRSAGRERPAGWAGCWNYSFRGGSGVEEKLPSTLVLWQEEVNWCCPNVQAINRLKVPVVAKERIAMLKSRRSNPHIIGRNRLPLAA